MGTIALVACRCPCTVTDLPLVAGRCSPAGSYDHFSAILDYVCSRHDCVLTMPTFATAFACLLVSVLTFVGSVV